MLFPRNLVVLGLAGLFAGAVIATPVAGGSPALDVVGGGNGGAAGSLLVRDPAALVESEDCGSSIVARAPKGAARVPITPPVQRQIIAALTTLNVDLLAQIAVIKATIAATVVVDTGDIVPPPPPPPLDVDQVISAALQAIIDIIDKAVDILSSLPGAKLQAVITAPIKIPRDVAGIARHAAGGHGRISGFEKRLLPDVGVIVGGVVGGGTGLVDELKEIVDSLVDTLGTELPDLIDAVEDLADRLGLPLVESLLEGLKDVLDQLLRIVKKLVDAVLPELGPLLDAILGLVNRLLGALGLAVILK